MRVEFGGIQASAVHHKLAPAVFLKESFRHLAARGIMGTQHEDVPNLDSSLRKLASVSGSRLGQGFPAQDPSGNAQQISTVYFTSRNSQLVFTLSRFAIPKLP